jgi:hypothetical protein
VFCVFGVIWRLINFITVTDVTARILAVVTFILSVYITRLVARFFAIVRTLPVEVIAMLRQLDYAQSSPVI